MKLFSRYPAYRRPLNHLNVSDFIEKFPVLCPDVPVALTGRITSIRTSGTNLHFLDMSQNCRKVQLILRQESFCGEISQVMQEMNKGDIVEAVGLPSRSKRGELSCRVESLSRLAPCLVNLPDEKIGIKNAQLRARKRHFDLIANPESFRVFQKRSVIVSRLRGFLESRGFLEVETPILSDLSGGAVAKPFRTKLSAHQDRPLCMRIAPELYLKRLLIGGFDRVFEIGKQFRDEGIDASHNPEFTSCELYAAYTDLEEMISLLEDLFTCLDGIASLNSTSLKMPFKRIDVMQELRRITGISLDPCDPEMWLDTRLLEKYKITPKGNTPITPSRVFDKLVGTLIEPTCQQPTLLYGPPLFTSPLARSCPNNPGIADRFEVFVQGRELANAYVELNDPEEQAKRFEAQAGNGDSSGEIPPADEDFIDALRTGMPPTTGCGIGIDRLVMLLTGQTHIKNVLLFPLIGSN